MGEGQGEEREGDEGGRRGRKGGKREGGRASCGEITMREWTPCRGSPVEWTYEEIGCRLGWLDMSRGKKNGKFYSKVVS